MLQDSCACNYSDKRFGQVEYFREHLDPELAEAIEAVRTDPFFTFMETTCQAIVAGQRGAPKLIVGLNGYDDERAAFFVKLLRLVHQFEATAGAKVPFDDLPEQLLSRPASARLRQPHPKVERLGGKRE